MCLFGKRRKEKKSGQQKEGRRRTAGGEGDEVPAQRSADYTRNSRSFDSDPPFDEVPSVSSRDSRERNREPSRKPQPTRPAWGSWEQSQGSRDRGEPRGARGTGGSKDSPDPYAKGGSWGADDNKYDSYEEPASGDDRERVERKTTRKTTKRPPAKRQSEERWSEERQSETSAGGRGSSKKQGCQDNCQGVPKTPEGKPRSGRRRSRASDEKQQPAATCPLTGCPSGKLKRARKRKRKPTYGQRPHGRRQPSYAEPPPYGAARRPPRSFLQCAYLPRGSRPTANCAGVLF